MTERLLGLESEYALTTRDRDGRSLDRENGVFFLIELARAHLPHLSGVAAMDLFLGNGSRLYVDSGLHPEFCTPECANPWDVVRYTRAGEKILEELMDRMTEDPEIADAALFKCNVDYSGTGSTWGCHESYLHRTDPHLLSAEVIPHLVSRVIYTGAGGFRVNSKSLEFSLSPRVSHLVREVSESSTHDRGIFHTKDESLSSSGYHRLHILCGENICSNLGSWLKVGTTAVVVAMIDAGLRPGHAVCLQAPLVAMRTFAGNPQCDANVPLANGNTLTARKIQQHYLELAEAHLHESWMPPWAPEVCRQWRAMLDRLAQAPQSVATCLDWAIKWVMFQNWMNGKGFSWETVPDWSHVLERLNSELGKTPFRDKSLSIEFVLGSQSPIRTEVKQLSQYLQNRGMSWDQLRPFIQLRSTLFEIDTRFGQIGSKGIFSMMDHQGVLDHAVPGVDNIEHAMVNPPAVGRGKIRGECVQRLSGNNGRYICNWDRILDVERKQSLDLADPFVLHENWRQMDEPTLGRDPAAWHARFIEFLEISQQLTPIVSNSRGRYRPGQSVMIIVPPLGVPREFVGRMAHIVSTERDEHGVFYRLNVDDGRYCWRRKHLQPA